MPSGAPVVVAPTAVAVAVMMTASRPVLGAAWVAGGAILFAGIALAISHGVSFWWNYLHGGEYRRVSAAQLMFAPYSRLLVLHMTIILAAVAIGTTGAQSAAVAILVLIKIAIDIGLHLAEHRRAATPPADVVIVQP